MVLPWMVVKQQAAKMTNSRFIREPNPILQKHKPRFCPEYRRDFLHLTEAGYARLNAKLRELTEPILDGDPPD